LQKGHEEPESGIDAPFDEPMNLLDEVVEIFTLSQLSAVVERSFFLQLLDRRRIGGFLSTLITRGYECDAALSILHQKFGRSRVRVPELRRPNYWTCTPKKYAITAFAICLASACILASLCNLPCSLRNAIIPAVMTAHSLRTCLSCADIDTNCGV
jgi:hypothetical protein